MGTFAPKHGLLSLATASYNAHDTMGKKHAHTTPQRTPTLAAKASISKKSPALPPPNVPPSSTSPHQHRWRKDCHDKSEANDNEDDADDADADAASVRYPLSGVKEMRLRGAAVGRVAATPGCHQSNVSSIECPRR
jgi:hypothetical protein